MLKIEINGTFLDLKEDIPLSFNYSIVDLKEPEKRKASFSKTINIPNTKTNAEQFLHSFMINIDAGFDANKKTPCRVYVDGTIILDGTLQLREIVINNDEWVEYRCAVYGQLIDLFSSIGKDLMTDLDLSEFDHAYTLANQENSWDTSIIQNGGSVGFALGNGYVYPLIDYGLTSDPNLYHVNDLSPAVYVKEYIDQIFTAAGFTYSSSFFDSNYFKSLIIPFSGNRLELSNAQIDARMFQA